MGDVEALIERIITLDNAGRSEDYVREELVVPMLSALGYEENSPFRVRRGVGLTRPESVGTIVRSRAHLYPDMVLEVMDRRCWIVECKSTKRNLRSEGYLRQLGSYLRSPEMGCRRGVLSNGTQFVLFEAGRKDRDLQELASFDVHEMYTSGSAREAFKGWLLPAGSFLRDSTLEEAIDIYRGGDWPTRFICMSRFMERGGEDIDRIGAMSAVWEDSMDPRERSLPALFLLGQGDESERLAERALSDQHDAVRDTFFTVVRNAAENGYRLGFSLRDAVPEGWFSRIAYTQMIAALLRVPTGLSDHQREVAEKQIRLLMHSGDGDVRFFAKLADRRVGTPFPFTAFMRTPRIGSGQDEIYERLLAVTLRQMRDPEYEELSRTSALNAVASGQLYHPGSIAYAREKLTGRLRRVLEKAIASPSVSEF